MRTPEEFELIGKAKQKLMRLHRCSEPVAYHAMRKAATDHRMPLPGLAQMILDARRPYQLLGRHAKMLKRRRMPT